MNCANCNYSNVTEAKFCANCGKNLSTPPPSNLQPSSVQYPPQAKPKAAGCSGMWIAIAAGCFLLIIILGIVAAIAIPSLLNSMQREKQKKTIADMNKIADALEDYFDFEQQYPDAKSMSELKAELGPEYLESISETDAWGNKYGYRAWTVFNQKYPTAYLLVSFGKDGVADAEKYYKGTRTTSFNNDIVISSGEFWQYPDGYQP